MFGQDPNKVYWKVSMDWLISVLVYDKEAEEYKERFQTIWREATQ